MQTFTLATRPRRIVRRRGRNSALPAGAIYVGRPTIWNNPFSGRQWGHAKSVKLHRQWLSYEIGALSLEAMGFCPAEIEALERLRARVLDRIHELTGRDLACWCPLSSRWCHADTLLNLAAIASGPAFDQPAIAA